MPELRVAAPNSPGAADADTRLIHALAEQLAAEGAESITVEGSVVRFQRPSEADDRATYRRGALALIQSGQIRVVRADSSLTVSWEFRFRRTLPLMLVGAYAMLFAIKLLSPVAFSALPLVVAGSIIASILAFRRLSPDRWLRHTVTQEASYLEMRNAGHFGALGSAQPPN